MGTIGDGSRRLGETDRAELCSRIDFPALLALYGFPVEHRADRLVARLREERTASCHVWPPGHGRHGKQGWTWHDFGTGEGGDALGFLADVAGVPFVEAVRELIDRTGYVPEGWGAPGAVMQSAPRPAVLVPPRPTLPFDVQREAVGTFWRLVLELPGAAAGGLDYLANRGIGAEVVRNMGGACKVTATDLRAVAEQLQRTADPSVFVAAGLAKDDERGYRCTWWDDTVLLPCLNRARVAPLFVIGRRLRDDGPKYVNQATAAGARRVPYGLPALADAARTGSPLLLVEGPVDALGAVELGWPGLALLTRLRAGESLQKLLPAALLADLALCSVYVVPDNDDDVKGADGRVMAAELVGWLRQRGIGADVTGLPELGLGTECKDLGEAAEARRQTT